jgi:hypothetical protein
VVIGGVTNDGDVAFADSNADGHSVAKVIPVAGGPETVIATSVGTGKPDVRWEIRGGVVFAWTDRQNGAGTLTIWSAATGVVPRGSDVRPGRAGATADGSLIASFSSHPGVALDEFSQNRLTFPPFTPRRILCENVWTRAGETATLGLVHPRVLRHSAHNLHRRVSDFSDSMVAVWFSSRTEDNQRGSIMQYTSHDGKLGAWYASLRVQQLSWQLHLAKGIDRARLEVLLGGDDAPFSGERITK